MLVEAKAVYRSFKVNSEEIKVLKGVDFAVSEGKLVVFMGPSGSGKTTLMNQLCLLDTPTSGEVYLFNERVDQLSEKQKDKIRGTKMGIIFQSVALVSTMTAYENVDFSLRIAKFPKKERAARVDACLKLVGLEKRIHHMPFEMSGGEQQRVAIARAIAHKPQIIFADEPTAELDTQTSQMVMEIFRSLVEKEAMTIVMTTHDRNMAKYADEIIRMKDGLVSQNGK